MNRHYNAVHIPNLICIDNTVALQCKCSDVRSRGWEKDRSTRNSHYHCTVCHWPRDRIPQLVNHMISRHNTPASSIHHLNKKKVIDLVVMCLIFIFLSTTDYLYLITNFYLSVYFMSKLNFQ